MLLEGTEHSKSAALNGDDPDVKKEEDGEEEEDGIETKAEDWSSDKGRGRGSGSDKVTGSPADLFIVWAKAGAIGARHIAQI